MLQTVEGPGPPLLSCTSPSCLWHGPQDLMRPQSCAESSFLSSSEKNACQEAQLFGECEIQYFNGSIFHVPLEKKNRVCCWSVCNWVLLTLEDLPDFDTTNSWYFFLPQRDSGCSSTLHRCSLEKQADEMQAALLGKGPAFGVNPAMTVPSQVTAKHRVGCWHLFLDTVPGLKTKLWC